MLCAVIDGIGGDTFRMLCALVATVWVCVLANNGITKHIRVLWLEGGKRWAIPASLPFPPTAGADGVLVAPVGLVTAGTQAQRLPAVRFSLALAVGCRP
jgi:hypothetical protein